MSRDSPSSKVTPTILNTNLLKQMEVFNNE